MVRKRQISSSPEEVSDDDELSEVASIEDVPMEDPEEDDEEQDELEEDDDEEEEEEEEDEDGDFEQQSEDEPEAASEEEEESDATVIPPPTTTTSKGRISRKPIPIQPVAPPVVTRPARSSTRAEPPPEPPKIKLRLTVAKGPQQEAMEEIKVENPPKEIKSAPKAAVEAKLVLPKISEKQKGKLPEVVVPEEDEEESSSSALEEDEEDLSEIDEDDIPGGTEMDIDEDDEDEETEQSRMGTPMDGSRLTKRQQARFNESLRPHSLMALPNGIQPLSKKLTTETLRKRPLTADEIALRRSETARRRKNQSEQRLEEEKIETINRLLKPQAPRRRGQRANDSPGPSDTEAIPRDMTPPPPPTKVRIVKTVEGTIVAIPDKWMDMFLPQKGPSPRTLEGCGKCGKTGIYPVNGKRACSLGCVKALKGGV
jgi:Ino eighty subunit 2